MVNLRFLCGCVVTGEAVAHQATGLPLCPQHSTLPYGWRTPTDSRGRLDWQEWRRRELAPALEFVPKSGIDRRDNRDPEKVGAAVLAKRNGQ